MKHRFAERACLLKLPPYERRRETASDPENEGGSAGARHEFRPERAAWVGV